MITRLNTEHMKLNFGLWRKGNQHHLDQTKPKAMIPRCDRRVIYLVVTVTTLLTTISVNRHLILQHQPRRLLLHGTSMWEAHEKKEHWDRLPTSDAYQGHLASVDFSYDDPRNYTGPVLRGWEPGRSRSFQDYLPPEKPLFLNSEYFP